MNGADPAVTLSIVSHGQGDLVDPLLDDLERLDDRSFRVVVTLNIPEDESFLKRERQLRITVLRNAARMGYGANHNAAFTQCSTRCFAVLNPDLRLPTSPMAALVASLDDTGAGVCAPRVVSPEGRDEDSVRRFPTLGRLARRVVLGQRRPDYSPDAGRQPVDWAAGMFLVFDSAAFRAIGGFDERYFMYMEDADICRRLGHAGRATVWQPAATVVHNARRSSHRTLRHTTWHLASALRFLAPRWLAPSPRSSVPRDQVSR
jgi:N-acetylglucosaminyl-diphospho-decaprenol L-rhamnosyltransferase